jgi:hypothetical protein
MIRHKASLAAKVALAHKAMAAARDVLVGHDIGVTVIVHDSELLPDDVDYAAETTLASRAERALIVAAVAQADAY